MTPFDDPGDRDLDARLRALFADGDFGVAAPAGTDARVLAGARRARRRATTVRSVSAVAAVSAAGAAFAAGAGGHGQSQVVAASTTPFYCPDYGYYEGDDGVAHLFTMYPTPFAGPGDDPGPPHIPVVTLPPTSSATEDPTGEPTGAPSATASLMPTDRPPPPPPPNCVKPTGAFRLEAPTPAPWDSVVPPSAPTSSVPTSPRSTR